MLQAQLPHPVDGRAAEQRRDAQGVDDGDGAHGGVAGLHASDHEDG